MNNTLTVQDLFARSVARHGGKTALVFYGQKITYWELNLLAAKFTNFLRKQYVMPGDRVALILPNCPQFVIAYLGTLQAGCVVTALNPLASTEEIVEMIKQSEPEFIVSLKDFAWHNVMIQKNLKGLQQMAVIGLADYLPCPLNLAYRLKNICRYKPWANYSWSDIMKSKTERKWPEVRPDDLAVLQFTGGTTGSPKAAKLTHQNLVSNALQALDSVGELIDENSVFLGVLPFFHVYGLSVCLNIALAKGSSIILTPKFNGDQILKLIKEQSVTHLPGIPRIFSALLKNKEIYRTDFSSLKLCVSGAGALDSEVKRDFEKITKAPIVEGYGLSEASPIVSINPPRDAKSGSLGKLVSGTQAKIVDGELWIQGPQVMAGYWGKPKETAEVLDKQGWLRTGDMVSIDEDGFLWFEDRKKDLIKIRGENVYPKEIEDVILKNPCVEEVAVVGLPDKELGEKIVACIVLKPNLKLPADDLYCLDIKNYCKDQLPSYKVPQEIRLFSKLPKNILGKVLKRELRKFLSDKAPS